MKKVWATEGREGAEAAHKRFEELVRRGLATVVPDEVQTAAVESDAAAILCRTTEAAVHLGRAMYLDAFIRNRLELEQQRRMWLRGAIIGVDEDVDVLRVETERDGVAVTEYSAPLLEAIEIERAGFRGMRLMIARDLLTRPVKTEYRIPFAQRALIPFRRLNFSTYPLSIPDYDDVLWMATADEDQWDRRVRRMSSRMRYAARDTEEIIQAAATQVVFDECTEIISSLGGY